MERKRNILVYINTKYRAIVLLSTKKKKKNNLFYPLLKEAQGTYESYVDT